MIFIKILELTSDIVFKSFMLSEATRKYKAKLINSITGIPINLLEHAIYTSQELRNNHAKEKVEEKLRNTELICAKNEGIEKGKNEEKVASIKRMKAKGLDDETICDFLGINLDEMKKLLKIQ